MKRLTSLICLLLVLSCTASAAAYDDNDTTSLFRWGPYLTNTTTNSTVVHWMTGIPVEGAVAYGSDATFRETGGYQKTVMTDANVSLHSIPLTGLLPDTCYHYLVTSGEKQSGDHTFRTFPEGGPFTFIVYGDTQEQTPYFTQMERHALVAERIATEEPEALFVLHVGDMVCQVGDEAEWERFFAAGNSLFANTTLVPVLGNHENNATVWYDAFGQPEWYSFNCGNAHFVVLDSNDWAAPHFDEETAWLKTDLDQNQQNSNGVPAGPTFVAFHHPPYSSGTRHPGGWTDIRALWNPVFEEYDVDMVFNGHVHSYQRYAVNKVQYIIAATGGGVLYNLTEEKTDGYVASADHELGYVRVTVDGDCVTSVFVPVAAVSSDNRDVVTIFPVGEAYDRVCVHECNRVFFDILEGISRNLFSVLGG